MDLIEPEDFIQQVLKESVLAYICHVIMIKNGPSQVHSSQIAQISTATAGTITLPETYKDFEDFFSSENADHLPIHMYHVDAVNLVDGNNSYITLFTNYPKINCQFFESTLTKI